MAMWLSGFLAWSIISPSAAATATTLEAPEDAIESSEPYGTTGTLLVRDGFVPLPPPNTMPTPTEYKPAPPAMPTCFLSPILCVMW